MELTRIGASGKMAMLSGRQLNGQVNLADENIPAATSITYFSGVHQKGHQDII
jgi:hypothetical protein